MGMDMGMDMDMDMGRGMGKEKGMGTGTFKPGREFFHQRTTSKTSFCIRAVK